MAGDVDNGRSILVSGRFRRRVGVQVAARVDAIIFFRTMT